jgi:hypothetical protein
VATVTVTTEQNHGFEVNQYVSINSQVNFTFTGVFKVESVPTPRSFTYKQIAMPNAPTFVVGPPKSSATQLQQVTVPESEEPPGYSVQPVSRFVAYTCILVPATDATKTPPVDRWSGTVRIVPSGWSIGTSSATLKICRYTGDYSGPNGILDGKVSNSEHPLVYRGVTGALDNQNYVAVLGSNNCPTDSAVDPLEKKYTNVNTTVHQTNDTLAGGGRSGTNEGGKDSNGGLSTAEPTSGDYLPMF